MSFMSADLLGFMRLYIVGGIGFAVCAALLIVMRKKTAPYIGAIASLAVLLLGNILYYDDTYRKWGIFVVYYGEPPAFIYIAVALAAAAVTLYWWTQQGIRDA